MHVQSSAIFRLFRSRPFRYAILAFQLLWLNVIVPGHRRGIVTLPGTRCAACEQEAINEPRAACPSDPKSPRHVPLDSAAHCAICFFAARLSPPVAYDFTHPPLRLVAVVDAPASPIGADPQLILPYQGRAPPSAV
jgi:hypothetical protein